MQIKLIHNILKAGKIEHKAGEILTLSDSDASHLVCSGIAEVVEHTITKPGDTPISVVAGEVEPVEQPEA